jgi:cytoskeletal protein CcmA (bactofilin family)
MIRARVSGTTVLILSLAATLVPTWRTALASDDDNSKVLGSVHVPAGQHTGDATTVNGSVEIGERAVVRHAETVNGSITMHQLATAGSVETVNGSARLEEGVKVSGSVEVVNGHISLDKDADVTGHLSNVNGAIRLSGAHVGGGIETTSGDIEIGAGSRVDGGIVVNKDDASWLSNWFGSWFNFGKTRTSDGARIPQVVIGPGATVKGQLKFLREVKLYVSDQASIGPVEGANPIKFSGDHPPPG